MKQLLKAMIVSTAFIGASSFAADNCEMRCHQDYAQCTDRCPTSGGESCRIECVTAERRCTLGCGG